jgi:hypothetical protein
MVINMKKEIDESIYEQVGHIRIKEPKKKKNGKKRDGLPLWQKIFVWAMFFAMLAGFIVPLVLYFINYAIAE